MAVRMERRQLFERSKEYGSIVKRTKRRRRELKSIRF